MKQDYREEGVGDTAFDLANGEHPGVDFKAHYGDLNVPKPRNHAAMQVNPKAIVDSFTKK